MPNERCDIFCNVIDNFGDIGVCWRLARQLANEYALPVRLWVDDLASFAALCPEANPALDSQHRRGVEVCRWGQDFSAVEPADLVIEAFACKLPEAYVAAMARQPHPPVWINLEYLSAEAWVEGCHKLPSPHPALPLTKYFFFPGFTPQTGGLLLERDFMARRDAFCADAAAQRNYWQELGVEPRVPDELRVSLFAYENAAIPELLRAWESGESPVTCLLPAGRSLPQVVAFFGVQSGAAGSVWQRGNLRVQVLPFVEQEKYDELLWACDINFVRGEDSCVRAQWAGKPFVWQIYPQHDNVHLEKLEALRRRYCAGLPESTALAVAAMWQAWNGGEGVAAAWQGFVCCRELLTQHGSDWSRMQSRNTLALNLLDFSRQVA